MTIVSGNMEVIDVLAWRSFSGVLLIEDILEKIEDTVGGVELETEYRLLLFNPGFIFHNHLLNFGIYQCLIPGQSNLKSIKSGLLGGGGGAWKYFWILKYFFRMLEIRIF